MSDILIKNMKMPENCVGCPLAKNYGMCAITKKTFNWGNPDRLSDCPLIEVPTPHGDLIDRMAFRYEMDNHYPFDKFSQGKHGIEDGIKSEILYLLYHAPTIIESEDE